MGGGVFQFRSNGIVDSPTTHDMQVRSQRQFLPKLTRFVMQSVTPMSHILLHRRRQVQNRSSPRGSKRVKGWHTSQRQRNGGNKQAKIPPKLLTCGESPLDSRVGFTDRTLHWRQEVSYGSSSFWQFLAFDSFFHLVSGPA